MIQGTAYVVAIETDAHVARLTRFLEQRFKRVVRLAPDGPFPKDANLGEDAGFRFFFFYPLNAIDAFSGNIERAVTIGMSNSLDLIGPVVEKQSQAQVAERLQQFKFIVVDSLSSLKYVTASSPRSKVFEVPWGLEQNYPAFPLSPRRSPTRKVLLSRLSSSYYQPELLIRACLKVLEMGHKLQFSIIMSEDRELELKGQGIDLPNRHIKIIRPMDEPSFVSILNEFDATLMAPRTDGTSVTMLQAMMQGVVVLSTPNQGSAEWVVNRRTGYLSRGDDIGQIVELIEEFAVATEDQLADIKDSAWKVAKLFANYESNMEVVLKELLSFARQSPIGQQFTSTQ